MHLECRGVKFPDDKNIITPRVRESITAGRYESKEATQVEKLLKEGDRVLEIGSGLGFISTIAARDPRTEDVLCYEADPRLISFIKSVHELNGIKKATVRNVALTTDLSQKELTFYVRKDFWGSSFAKAAGEYESTAIIPTQSFNEVVQQFRPTFIVCDIEGAELDLFFNASLFGVTRVLMEIHSRVLGRAGVKRLFDAMSARDFHYDEFHSHGSVVLFSHVKR
ncbi:FkbM family methyltransferase [Sinorhizobium meliloti]|uniref:FkbM family methyltransferase n=1 Tax=Rhizobium meliloti TaxID=382 RepID=A0A2J0YVK3_RHIML|nr:FkbM family methyltransferase [Sinorhizobium meliloti]PJR11332.1 FkbM family methyltransferase [Sinorhizobium meliloti]